MTFLVSYQGGVYEKDLGPNTASVAAAMTAFNPDKTWQRSNDRSVRGGNLECETLPRAVKRLKADMSTRASTRAFARAAIGWSFLAGTAV